MANTGVKASDEAADFFQTFKKSNNKQKFALFKIDGAHIVLEQASDDQDFENFRSLLPADEGRFAVYKYAFTTADGRPTDKLVFIAWSPDDAPVKKKMLYAGSKDALLRVCEGISAKITATDKGEVTVAALEAACTKV